MKYVLYTLLTVMLIGCRTNKHSDIQYNSDTETKSNYSDIAKLSTIYGRELQVDYSTFKNLSGRIRTIEFDSTGRISSIREERWDTGSTELLSGNDRRSDVYLSDENKSTDTHTKTKIDATERRESVSDSRPVQGIEWFYVVFAVALVIAVIIIIKKKKKK